MEDKRQEYAQNLTKMRKCNKIYNIVSIIYIVLFGFLTVDALVGSVFVAGGFSMFAFSLVCAAVLALGFLAAYKKNNLFALIAPLLVLITAVIGFAPLALVPIPAVLSGLTYLANKDYEELSHQEGFPMFSYHLKEHDEKKKQDEIKTEYEAQYENYVSQSSNDMEELPETEGCIAPKTEEKNNYMDEL